MKLLRIIFPALLAISGCEKSSNQTALQDETAGLANHYRSRFEELQRRYLLIDRSKSKAAIDASKEMKPLWSMLQRRLGELRNAAMQAQNSIAAANKSPNPSADLIRLQSDLRERLSRGEIEVVAQLHAVESFLANLAYAPKVAVAGHEHDGMGPNSHDKGHDPGHAHGGPDAAKTDAKTEAPKPDAKMDATKTDTPKTDAPKTDAPKTEAKAAPKTDAKAAPKADAPKATAPKKDAPKKKPAPKPGDPDAGGE